ncbi:hypothetical protein Salat_2564000 [Sesamum alatum]|uniref:Uncharacterized protein n=1 Tax=Sesamum alatum TaxID=300844 RepID=A0AAE1XSS5_9LAMI|nr:hypothetical protein Salat_2564000 [Sesamum alatum]
MGADSTSDWTSSRTSGPSSPPPVSWILPQKIRGKMPRRTRVSFSSENASPVPAMASIEAMAVISGTPTTMTEESISKLVAQIALPATYDWVLPSASDSTSDPPPGFLTVYSAQLVSGLRFPLPPLLVKIFNLLGIPPSQLFSNSYRKSEWDVPTAWACSVNALPPLNLGDTKRVMKEAGLVDHEFNAKAILNEELLIVAGLHPAPDRYEGPLDRITRFRIMMNRAVMRKFIPNDVPAMPSSSEMRSARSTPSDLSLKLTPTSTTTLPSSASVSCPQETPVIDVVTSPEDVPPAVPPTDLPSDVNPSSLFPPLVEELPSSHKRPRIAVEGAEDTPTAVGPSEPVFPALVLTPCIDPQAGAFNMSKAVNQADVEVLIPRTFTGIGNLMLSQASVIPTVVTAVVEKYAYSLKNCEMLHRELQETKAAIRGQHAKIEAKSRERENKLKEELDAP